MSFFDHFDVIVNSLPSSHYKTIKKESKTSHPDPPSKSCQKIQFSIGNSHQELTFPMDCPGISEKNQKKRRFSLIPLQSLNSLFRSFWRSFWGHFGVIFWSFWSHFTVIQYKKSIDFIIFDHFDVIFDHILKSFYSDLV